MHQKQQANWDLTQQAVSEQLKKLRDVIDDRLFLRKTNGLFLRHLLNK
jgi:DNA-binding transcriptional LysR family regulator